MAPSTVQPSSFVSTIALFVAAILASNCLTVDGQGTSATPSIDVLIAYPSKHDHKLMVVEPGTPVTLTRGEAYDLACHFQPEVSPEWQVTWKKTAGDPFVNDSQSYIMGWLGTLHEDFQLRMLNFSSTDAGFYWCLATDPRGVTRQTSAILQVVPEIAIDGVQKERVAPVAGGNVQLTCQAGGYPVPTISWHRNGAEVVASSTLVIPTVSHASNGTYQCVAKNNAGTVRQKADVVVVEQMRWLTSPAAQVTVRRNGSVTVECRASGVPSPLIEWAKFTDRYHRLFQLDGKTSITLQANDITEGDRFVCIARSPYPCCIHDNTQTPLLSQFQVMVSDTADEAPTPSSNQACIGSACSAGNTLQAVGSGIAALILAHLLALFFVV